MAGRGRDKGAVFLMASLLGAFAVTYMIYTIIQQKSAALIEVQRPETTFEVVIAARDIPPGLTIMSKDLQTRELPDDYIPAEVYRSPDEVIGRVAMERVLKGEFIRDERLADPDAGIGLNAIVPRGMRALSVDVKDAAAVSGFLNPGNYVDIIGTFTDTDQPSTRSLLRGVTVLAVNDRLTDAMRNGDADDDPRAKRRRRRSRSRIKPSITIAVTPEQAEVLTHAADEGEITLALRNDIDVTHIESNDTEAEPEEEVAEAAPAPAPAPRRKASKPDNDGSTAIEVIRGSERKIIRNR